MEISKVCLKTWLFQYKLFVFSKMKLVLGRGLRVETHFQCIPTVHCRYRLALRTLLTPPNRLHLFRHPRSIWPNNPRLAFRTKTTTKNTPEEKLNPVRDKPTMSWKTGKNTEKKKPTPPDEVNPKMQKKTPSPSRRRSSVVVVVVVMQKSIAYVGVEKRQALWEYDRKWKG